MKKSVMIVAVIGLVSLGLAMAGIGFLQAIYRSDTILTPATAANAFTVSYTNDTGLRVMLGSVFARSTSATGNWSVILVNNSQSHILVAPTALSSNTYSIKYEGYGTTPLGNGGVVTITGSVGSNTTATLVEWNVNTLNAQ